MVLQNLDFVDYCSRSVILKNEILNEVIKRCSKLCSAIPLIHEVKI